MTGSRALTRHHPTLSRKRERVGAVITAACHNAEELALAHSLGANLAFLSPAFATASHPDAEHLGATMFKALAAASPLPVLALGGVNETNALSLTGKNVAGLAAIDAFIHAAE
jgi:thiamine-phosphate pyrophosphorylase